MAASESESLSAAIAKAIAASPVLSYFQLEAKLSRGRFHLEWRMTPEDPEGETLTWGRITPLAGAKKELLLEVDHREGRWTEVAQGSMQKVMRAVYGDTKGLFHALGSLDTSLRKLKKGADRLPVNRSGKTGFVYSDTGKRCSVQEALFHYFQLPLWVIAEPRVWYKRYRTPRIAEVSADRQRILVQFSATSMSGETFGGACLYLCYEGEWDAYTIRPSKSGDIATAEAWLVGRKWRVWC